MSAKVLEVSRSAAPELLGSSLMSGRSLTEDQWRNLEEVQKALTADYRDRTLQTHVLLHFIHFINESLLLLLLLTCL